MRKPLYPERLYADFDGFFAGCEQTVHPHLRGKPVGIVPMPKGSSCVIAVSPEAKARGVKGEMRLSDVQRICPEIILWPQNPELYRRFHNEVLSEIDCVAPVDAVKSIDELTCRLDPSQQRDPAAVGVEIKRRIAHTFGSHIKISIGHAPNRLLAKMACKDSKPNGNLVWWPHEVEDRLKAKYLTDVPGIATARRRKLERCNVYNMAELLAISPRHMRAIWGNLHGEQMWYALHGYDVQAQQTQRGMFGHSRILPPSHRTMPDVRDIARHLMYKAAKRMRRDGFRAGALFLGLAQITPDGGRYWHRSTWLAAVADYKAVSDGFDRLWRQAQADLIYPYPVLRADVSLKNLTPIEVRQLDLLEGDEAARLEMESLSAAMDRLNHRYGRNLVNLGAWRPPPGDHTGQKIAYNRIPRREDAY